MPIYEYRCQVCDRHSEILIRGAGDTPTCPHCGSDRLERRLSPFAVSGASSSGEIANSGSAAPSCGCGCAGCG